MQLLLCSLRALRQWGREGAALRRQRKTGSVYEEEERSPDGRFLVRYGIETGRMSHEIWTPTIIDLASRGTILHIRQHGIDGRPQWQPGGFTLGLRSYHYPHLSLTITVDLARGVFRIGDAGGEEPLATLSERVDAELVRQMGAARSEERGGDAGRIARNCGLVLGAGALIALLAFVDA